MIRGISLNSLIIAFSKTIDLLDKKLHTHHWNVAYIAMQIAEASGCSPEQVQNIIHASLLHDIGIFKTDDRKKLQDYVEIETIGHEDIGCILLEESGLLTHLIPIIRDHHLHHSKWTKDTPREAGIIYLADRITVLLDEKRSTEEEFSFIMKTIQADSGSRFCPILIEAFESIAKNKAFWLDIRLGKQEARIRQGLIKDEMITSFERMMSIGHLFITAVDFRSRFTAAHSYGVATIAKSIGECMDLSLEQIKILELAGFYHDIGKIAIPKEILDKPDKLTPHEMELILGHSYFTYDVLSGVEGLSEYAHIAAYHHESIDGSGYPFGVSGKSLDIMSRIVAVADIFAAITEERPYRKPLEANIVKKIIEHKVNQNKIDKDIAHVVLENFELLLEKNSQCQQRAYLQFKAFEKKVFERTGIVIK